MHVVRVSLMVTVVLSLPHSSLGAQCPADGVVGCSCSASKSIDAIMNSENKLSCSGTYTGERVPTFRMNSEVYFWVNISQTGITRVQAFVLLNIKPVTLDLVGNRIVTIHAKAFWTSESNNKTAHTELKYIDIGYNHIKYIAGGTFDPLINLVKLYLYHNRLSNLDNRFIVNLNKLELFNIAYNELRQLPTDWLPTNLRRLYVNGNPVENVSMTTFERAFNLYTIKLSPNAMIIANDTFGNLSKLTTIEVDHSDLYICTCAYIWYLNTKSNSKVCNNSTDKYASIRTYLKEECKTRLPDIADVKLTELNKFKEFMREIFKEITSLEKQMETLEYNISTSRIHTYKDMEELESSLLHNNIYNNYFHFLTKTPCDTNDTKEIDTKDIYTVTRHIMNKIMPDTMWDCFVLDEGIISENIRSFYDFPNVKSIIYRSIRFFRKDETRKSMDDSIRNFLRI